MPTRQRITDHVAKSIPPPAKGRLSIYDEAQPKLALRVTDKGSRTWYFVGRVRAGGMAWVRLGSVDDLGVSAARAQAAIHAAQAANRSDPALMVREAKAAEGSKRAKVAADAKAAEQHREGACPILAVAEDRTKELQRKGKSPWHVKDIQALAQRAYKAGIRDLADPKHDAAAAKWLDGLTIDPDDDESDGLSPLTVGRFRRHLVALGRHAVRRMADKLPQGRLPFFNLTGQGVALPDPPAFHPDEARLLASDAALALPGGLLWFFLLETGCRYKEGAWARWDRISLDGGTYEVAPPTTAERKAGFAVKGNKSRTVHLPAELVAVLRPLRRDLGYLFDDQFRSTPHRCVIELFRAHLLAVGIPLTGSDEPEGGPRTERQRRIHSLRHTHAFLMMAAGCDSMALRLAMGHAGPEMQAHYAAKSARWRTLLAKWKGELRLRDPAGPALACVNTDTCTVSA